MFGYAAFAQSPYAALGGTLYAVATLENFSSADSMDALRTAIGDIIESISIDANNQVVVQFSSSALENLNLANSQTGLAAFVTDVLEAITTANNQSALRTQFSSQLENIDIAEHFLDAAWIRINDNQSTTWTLIDNRQ